MKMKLKIEPQVFPMALAQIFYHHGEWTQIFGGHTSSEPKNYQSIENCSFYHIAPAI